MKILALDSSGLVASVAVVENDVLIAEYTMNYKKTHSQTLVPMLDEMSKMVELDLKMVDAIAVSAGPGSFTGLRIGSATAKGLGLALQKPLIAIPTVDALAYNLHGTDKLICPILDARRNQVYTGIYSFAPAQKQNGGCLQEYQLQVIKMQCALPIQEIAEELNSLGREVIFLGDGVPVFAEILTELMTVSYSFAPAHMNRQRAASVAALAAQYAEAGQLQCAGEHKPEYLRLSQAEREQIEQAARKQGEQTEPAQSGGAL